MIPNRDDHLATVRVNGASLVSALRRGDVLASMTHTADLSDALGRLAGDLIEAGVKDGMTQRQMASALGVPVSALRGARREFS